ncbi:energy transducer TonB [Lysobacter capsici]|uniref:energy transducer TonB n=1 Tax=Lysobacter capsici TaxID=435897 RepID=UPI001BFFF061|nr:energy transducer TonB [Lysobacter capsici]QWF19163.1 energy transducer TonB [Lysobacter capsici]
MNLLPRSLFIVSPRLGALLATGLLAALAAGCGPRDADQPIIPSTPLRAVDTPPPEYPIEIGCDQIGGKVVLQLTVGPEGKPTKATVLTSSKTQALDDAALKGVQRWRFEAATRNGKPVATDIQVPVTFNAPASRPEHCGPA